jgi:hypothetical protein
MSAELAALRGEKLGEAGSSVKERLPFAVKVLSQGKIPLAASGNSAPESIRIAICT